MKYSHQKQTLIGILQNSEKHYSTEQIHNKLKKVIPNVSLMTVYRNLNKLVKEGVVLPFHIDNVMHFCGNNKQHFHMHCVACGKVVDGYRTEINNAVESAINKDFYHLRLIQLKPASTFEISSILILIILKLFDKISSVLLKPSGINNLLLLTSSS